MDGMMEFKEFFRIRKNKSSLKTKLYFLSFFEDWFEWIPKNKFFSADGAVLELKLLTNLIDFQHTCRTVFQKIKIRRLLESAV